MNAASVIQKAYKFFILKKKYLVGMQKYNPNIQSEFLNNLKSKEVPSMKVVGSLQKTFRILNPFN